MRGVILVCVLTACASTTRAPTPPRNPLVALGWLSGIWCGQVDGDTFCEAWQPDAEGALIGEGTIYTEGVGRRVETLRLEARGDGVYYVATPVGEATTAFRRTRFTADEVVFENPTHDFPTRITYRRGPHDALDVVVEGGGRRLVFALMRNEHDGSDPRTYITRARRLDATLRCDDGDAGVARRDAATVSLSLNTGGDQGQIVQAGLVLALDLGDRVCTAQVASCDHASAGEGAACDGDPVCVRFVGDAVTVERRGAVIFRDRAPTAAHVDEGAVTCPSQPSPRP